MHNKGTLLWDLHSKICISIFMVKDLRESVTTKHDYIYEKARFLLPGPFSPDAESFSPHPMTLQDMSKILKHVLVLNKYLCEIVRNVLSHIHYKFGEQYIC